MSWKCKTQLRLNDFQLPFVPFRDAFPPVELLSGHQWEDSGHTGRLLVEMCQTVCCKWYSADLSIRSDDTVIVEVDSGRWEEDHRGRSGGEALMAQLTLSDKLSDGFPLIGQRLQSLTEKAATWRRNRLQPRELQCQTHMYIHTSKNTHSHTRTSTHGLGQSPKADSRDNQSGE